MDIPAPSSAAAAAQEAVAPAREEMHSVVVFMVSEPEILSPLDGWSYSECCSHWRPERPGPSERR